MKKCVPQVLVLYARTDGSYAIWDPYDIKQHATSFADSAIVLRNHEVWGCRVSLGQT